MYLINLILDIGEESFDSGELAAKNVTAHLKVQIWNQESASLRLKQKINEIKYKLLRGRCDQATHMTI